MKFLKAYLVENCGLAADADDAAVKAAAEEQIKAGKLTLEKYSELLNQKSQSPADKLAEMLDASSQKTAQAVSEAVAKALQEIVPPKTKKSSLGESGDTKEADDESLVQKQMAELDEWKKSMEGKFKDAGGDGAALMKMAYDDASDDPRNVRVKQHVERYSHTPTALCYKSGHAKRMGISDQPMSYNGKEVNRSTDRTKYMSAVWMKFQMFPEQLSETEVETVRYILHREKFHVPNADPNKTESRILTPQERDDVYKSHMDFYTKAVIDDGTSGGSHAVPEFFDMDMIITPTLADENIPAFCNVIPVPRGSSAQNFVLGRPTIAAHTEGSAVTPFSTSGFITNHDTSFFRAMGAIEIGKNFAEDAHPRLVEEIQARYMESVLLWFNEQIMAGDGTTEPQGIIVASGTTDITPATPTTGAIVLTDAFDMLFGVGKAYRMRGGRMNACYVMTETTYKAFRRIATGVTGDTRLVFGDDVESYEMFGHPVLIEENGLSNSNAVFAQLKGYRLYLRQGARFFREDRGSALVRANSFLVGCDVRAGGQLDEGGYAAVVDAYPST